MNDKGKKIKDILLSLSIIIISVGTYFFTYFNDFSGSVSTIIWIAWILAVIIMGYFTTTGQQIFQFALAARIELLKVVWPTRQETMQTTTIVMVMVGLTGFILWGVDSIMMWIISKLTHLG